MKLIIRILGCLIIFLAIIPHTRHWYFKQIELHEVYEYEDMDDRYFIVLGKRIPFLKPPIMEGYNQYGEFIRGIPFNSNNEIVRMKMK